MTERMDYDALASAIKLREITSDRGNATLLRRLKDGVDDAESACLLLCEEGRTDTRYPSQYYLNGASANSMGWLGYFVGNNPQLDQLVIMNEEPLGDILDRFFDGLQRNTSITTVDFQYANLLQSDVFGGLGPFFANNTRLTSLELNQCCEMDPEQCRSLSLALAKGKSLTHFIFRGEWNQERQQFADEHIVEIILALSMHPQLETLQLSSLRLGGHSFAALSTLLQWRATALEHLTLNHTGIDNEGVKVVVNAIIARPGSLRMLSLCSNPSITGEACQVISTLLTNPNCALADLSMYHNDQMDDECAIVLANALRSNRTLTRLNLSGNDAITKEGWTAFANVLCDTSNGINETFMSNHTLRDLSGPSSLTTSRSGECRALFWYMTESLQVNSQHDTKTAAIIKILTHHDNVDVRPLFEWEFKALPIAIQWLERTAGVTYEERQAPGDISGRPREIRTRPVGRWELSVMYQFVRGMPALFIEARVGGGKSK